MRIDLLFGIGFLSCLFDQGSFLRSRDDLGEQDVATPDNDRPAILFGLDRDRPARGHNAAGLRLVARDLQLEPIPHQNYDRHRASLSAPERGQIVDRISENNNVLFHVAKSCVAIDT